jgi:chitinase
MRLILGTAIANALAAYVAFAGHSTAANDGLESYFAAHPVSTSTLVSINSIQSPSIDSVRAQVKKPSATSNTARIRCPKSCNGSKPNNWTVYHDVDRLALCNQTMLLDFALYNPLGDHRTHASIRSCTGDYDSSFSGPGRLTTESCRSNKNLKQREASLQMAWLGSSNAKAAGDVVAAAQQMERYISQSKVGCNSTTAFAYSGQAALGLYAGSGIQSQSIVSTVLQQFSAHVEANGISENLLVQLCATNGQSSRLTFGVMANTNSNLSSVQHAVKTWRDGKCVTEYDEATVWKNITLLIPSPPSPSNSTSTATQISHGLNPRATCTTVRALNTDTCGSLAVECGITPAQFTVYNPSTALCSTEGQHFCCSSGTLPDFAPKPNSDGTCHSYLVQKDDNCSQLSGLYSLSVALLESFNAKTWGWMGCADLQAGGNICLSTGSPPMPAPLVNAVCGPQVPGTPTPPAGTDLSTLNECALNACCDIWGQCGM